MPSLLPSPELQFADANGRPYAGGTLATYIPGTTTPVTTWQDVAGTVQSTNPVVLDAAGRCLLFATGSVRLILKDALGNTVYDQVSQAGDVAAAAALAGAISPAMAPVVAATTTTAALGQLGYVDTAAGAITRSVAAKFADLVLSLTDFGADPTGATPCDARWAAFEAAVMATGRRGWIPPGTYTFAAARTMDFGGAAAHAGAADFRGVLNRSILDFSAVAAGPALTLSDLTGNKNLFYGVFKDISIRADCPGPAVSIGATDHSVAFNGFDFGIQIANANATASAIGLATFGCFNCKIWTTSNNGGHGDAMLCDYMAFCEVFGAFGHADSGLHLNGYYVFGNVFTSLDIEVVNTCVTIDSANASRNTFVGGQYVSSNGTGPQVANIAASAGDANRFIGQNWGTGPVTSATTGIIIAGYPHQVGTEYFGGLYVSPPSGDGDIGLDSVAGNSAFQQFRVAGSVRWSIGRDSAAESGANAGSDFLVTRYTDAGAGIDNPFYITRSTGVTNIAQLEAAAVGFFGNGIVTTRPGVTGSVGGNAALASLVGALASMGLITNSTTA